MSSKGAVLVRLRSAREAVLDARVLIADANAEQVAAMRAAAAVGVSQAEIGRLLGMTRQAVRDIFEKGKR
jgi:predicted transcriptional regulator